ncbi:MAG: restriction endonuclease subunit S [Planctomycetaceae bacterium]|nr:restriction endonuclease subunit S [Planctomycetaceae bacterium]
MSVRNVPLGDVLQFFNGKAPNTVENGEFVVYGSNGTIGRAVEFNNENAIILGRVGAYCGSVEICHDRFWASDNTIVVKPLPGMDLRYLYYRLKASPLRSYAGGAAQPLITHGILRSINVLIECELRAQQHIASILSAYDDLIENNRRRIQLLEQAARLLYKEWFVNLRFPGHEHVKITEGVPKGWERKSMPEIAEFRLGKMLDQNKNRGQPMPYLANINVRWGEFDLENLREMRFEESEIETFGLRYGDIVMCEGGEPGRCAIWKNQIPGMMIQKAIHRIRPLANVDYRFLYYSLFEKARSGSLSMLFTGATIKHLPREKLARVQIDIPPVPLMRSFMEHVAPIENQIDTLQSQIRLASKARDLLLPRLMNGEISV